MSAIQERCFALPARCPDSESSINHKLALWQAPAAKKHIESANFLRARGLLQGSAKKGTGCRVNCRAGL
jgi:hypothetical protein